MIREYKNNTELVEQILKDHPKTRDCDIELFIKLAETKLTKKVPNIGMIWIRYALRMLPQYSTISRIRRNLQSKKKYPASDTTKRRRKKAEAEASEMLSSKGKISA